MEMSKQIEEMANYLDSCPYAISNATTEECKRTAKILIYEANCRIIPEGSVIIPEVIYEDMKNYNSISTTSKLIKQARNETVKEILQEYKVHRSMGGDEKTFEKWLSRRFGVEVEDE